MPTPNHTLEDLQAQLQTVRKAMATPGLPADEKLIYEATLQKIQLAIGQKLNAKANQPEFNEEAKMRPGGYRNEFPQEFPTRQPNTNPAPTVTPTRIITPGSNKANAMMAPGVDLEFNNESTKHNPIINIRWADGYSISVTESECLSRFRTTFRDCMALKCVSKSNYDKIWRWDTPWRSAGFLQALGQFNQGQIPSDLRQLEYSRPTEAQRSVFALILEKASINSALVE